MELRQRVPSHADWIYGNCIEVGNDGAEPGCASPSPPDQVVIEDTWTVAGLCGTGSHHFHVDDVLVPSDRTLLALDHEPALDGRSCACRWSR